MMIEKNRIKIGIVGYGFVGKAVGYGFSKNTEILKVDPKLKTSVKDLISFKPDICFICLPTPMSKNGQNIGIILDVVKEINQIKLNTTIVLKSTILPSALKIILDSCKIPIVYNPEFLREKHYKYDFENPEMIILSGKPDQIEKIKLAYKNNSICKKFNFIELSFTAASLAKYAINSFLASKVIFFNQLKEIYDSVEEEGNWDSFIETISTDKRIGLSHLNVPGHDGRKGFGGACFPKDTYALIHYAKHLGKDFEMLEKVFEINNSYRSMYDELDDREKEQDVFFNSN